MIDLIEKKIEELAKTYTLSKDSIKKEIDFEELKNENNIKVKYKNTLVIESVKIKGIKKDGIIFEENFKFYQGINVISTNGNNFKGKTTLLEIIKYLLTGNNKNVPIFATKIIENYEIILRVNFQKYKFNYDKSTFKILKVYDGYTEITGEGKLKDAESFLSLFFSKHFNYHILKYSRGGKSSLDLTEVALDWKSYFGSIYLKDYRSLITENFFGGLKSKIVQILFNLDFNRVINSLELKLGYVQRELQKYKMLEVQRNSIKETEKKLEKVIEKINKELKNLYLELEDVLEFGIDRIRDLKKKKSEFKIQKADLENEQEELKSKKIILNKKKIKKEQEDILKKYLPNDYSCPICQKEFKTEEKIEKIERGICYICGETHIYEENMQIKNRNTEFQDMESENIDIRHKKIREFLSKIELEEEKIDIELKKMEEQNLESEAEELSNKIKIKKMELYENKSKLETISEFKKLNKEEDLVKKIGILNEIVSYIKNIRYKSAEEKINSFREEFREESIKIGVTGLDSITFNEKDFDVIFYKDEEKESFDKLSDGEKLRVKIAFYLTWIQRSLKGDESIHPAFLMIDSPGKEETNANDLEELSKIFYDLNEKSEEFQIIIASAKNLPKATTTIKNKVYTNYLF